MAGQILMTGEVPKQVFLVILAVFLVGCSPKLQTIAATVTYKPALTSSPTIEARPSPSPTFSPSSTPTPTPSQSGIFLDKQTVYAAQTGTQSAYSTLSMKIRSPLLTQTGRAPTRVPSVTPGPPVPPELPSFEDSSIVQLITPSPKDILDIARVIEDEYNYFQDINYSGESNPNRDFLFQEIFDVQDVIDYEIQTHYPNGFPEPELIWNYYPLRPGLFQIHPKRYFDLLTDVFFADVSQNLIRLTDQMVIEKNGYKAEIFRAQIDLDPDPEWLVLMRWTEVGALTWLVLDESPGPTYTRLAPGLPVLDWASDEWDDKIEILQDFTGDGLTDVIFLDSGYLMGTYFGTFYVAQGTPRGFEHMSDISQATFAYESEGLEYRLSVPETQGWLTLVISNPNSINWDCQWDTVSSYRWPYGVEQVVTTGEKPPNTPDCFLARATSIYDPADNLSAIQWLEYAIKHFDESDPVQFAKIQFAHYRLAVLYALEGLDLPARQHLQWFADHYDQSPAFLQDKLLPLLQEQPLNPLQVCSLMASADYSELPEIWLRYANATAAFNAYPYSDELYPPVLCPLRGLLNEKLQSVSFNPFISPEAALIKAGIPAALAQAYPIPGQLHPAWFVLLGTGTIYGAGYVPGPDGWGWQLMYRFDPSSYQPQKFFEDVTGDGYPELVYFLPNDTVWGCSDQQQGHELFLTTASGLGFISINEGICAPRDRPIDVREYLADQDKDGLVDWVVEQIKEYAGDSFLTAERVDPLTWFSRSEIMSLIQGQDGSSSILSDYAGALYNSSSPAALRQEILAQRNSLDWDDPLTPRVWQQYTYLVAVSYELEGLDDQAVETFLKVIQAEPHTLWGNLAAMHVQGR